MTRTRLTAVVVLTLGLFVSGHMTVFPASPFRVYLPVIINQQAHPSCTFRVNAPHLAAGSPFSEMTVFWFGRVTPTENYADVRVSYDDQDLVVHVAIFDRRLWYDATPSPQTLRDWDATTLLLNLRGNTGEAPGADSYRFVGQLNWWESPRDRFQAAYRGDGTTWDLAPISFSTQTGWRGNAPRDDVDDRGWSITYRIPFASLGLSGPPPSATSWGMAIMLHDRDDAAGTPIADKTWPSEMAEQRPTTWGQLGFGLRNYAPPPSTAGGSVTIRHKLNGATVVDAAVGGTIGNLCPGDSHYIWNKWGDASFAGASDFNIQNQYDVADWPCFAKYYVTFPVDAVPAGKVIRSATLTLHQFGNSGGGNWGPAEPSWIQVLTAEKGWNEATLSWNGAPLARENIGGTWVNPMDSPLTWPGVPWHWDVSLAAARAYETGEPLRLVLYSADTAYHSGKYFVSSDTGDWNATGRPTLTVEWGNP
jgi:hypothetical protein